MNIGKAKEAPGPSGAAAAAAEPSTSGRLSREEAIAAIRADYADEYFVTGKGQLAVYEEDCLFADPFAGFRYLPPSLRLGLAAVCQRAFSIVLVCRAVHSSPHP